LPTHVGGLLILSWHSAVQRRGREQDRGGVPRQLDDLREHAIAKPLFGSSRKQISGGVLTDALMKLSTSQRRSGLQVSSIALKLREFNGSCQSDGWFWMYLRMIAPICSPRKPFVQESSHFILS
jgi:hypothetical protein